MKFRAVTVWMAFLALMLPVSTRAQSDTFVHDTWNRVLDRFVDDSGRVDYSSLRQDRGDLDRYLEAVASTSPATHPERFPTKDHELAYYINAYNALVFAGVLNLPMEVDSVWGTFGTGFGFFVRMKVKVGGETTNLRKLENKIIRERYGDPRIHAVLNCASASCPRLPRHAFEPQALSKQLDAGMREFVGEARNCRIEPSEERVYLSKIFDWFREDFESFEESQGNEDGDLIDYINRYREPGARIPASFRIGFLDYDKSLNRQ